MNLNASDIKLWSKGLLFRKRVLNFILRFPIYYFAQSFHRIRDEVFLCPTSKWNTGVIYRNSFSDRLLCTCSSTFSFVRIDHERLFALDSLKSMFITLSQPRESIFQNTVIILNFSTLARHVLVLEKA